MPYEHHSLQACILLALLLLGKPSQATDAKAIFEQGNKAYQHADYAAAEKNYAAALQAGGNSAELQYNLGNCYYKLNELGKAILHYERALRLAPGDADARHNLAIAQQAVPNELGNVPPFFLAAWWRATANVLSSNMWSVLALALAWCGLGGLATWQLSSIRRRRKYGFLLGMASILLAAITLGLAHTKHSVEQRSGEAVVIEAKTQAHTAPEQDATPLYKLPAGTKVGLLDQIGDWHKVRLSNGEQAWLPSSSVEEI